jgi:hypothetical protein
MLAAWINSVMNGASLLFQTDHDPAKREATLRRVTYLSEGRRQATH